MCLFSLLKGGIQCSPVKGNFSFLINQDLEVRRVYTAIESAAVFNCTTNDLTANVTLNRTDSQLRQEKITRNGAVFTIHGITRHDAGHYLCVAKRKNGQVITRKILLYIDSSKFVLFFSKNHKNIFVMFHGYLKNNMK